MKTSNRSLIITFLIILAVLLMALIGLLLYNIWQLRQPPPSSATIYLVDSSIRMAEPLGEGATSRLEAAQQFVSRSAFRLPDTEIVSVHVFGSGVDTVGCEDTVQLVQLDQGNQTEIVEKISGLNPISSDAALVRSAIEALEELYDTNFKGVVQLIIVTGGDGTCGDDLEQIVRTANTLGFEIKTIVVPVSSNREPVVINIPDILGAIEIVIDSEESITEGIELINSAATRIVIAARTSTPSSGGSTPPVVGAGTAIATVSPVLTPPPIVSVVATTALSPTPTSATGEPSPSPTSLPGLPTNTPNGTITAIPTSSKTPTLTSTPVSSITPNATAGTTAPNSTATPLAATSTPTLPLPTATPTNSPSQPTSTPQPTAVPPTSPPPDSRISILDAIVNESAGNVLVTLRRADVNNKAISVNYVTSNGTALAGSDYTAVSGQVAWAANNATDQTIVIPITNDLILESSESFNVLLSNSVNASIQDGTAVVTIQDNESGGILISPSSITVSEGAGNTSAGITLNGEPQGTVTVNLTSTDTDLCIPVSSVVLNASNWNSGVPIGITIVDNPGTNTAGFSNCIIQTSASTSTDPNFNNVNPVDINIQIVDNDATYVDQTCPDSDANGICDDGIRFKTIQAAINNGTLIGSSLNILVTTGPHVESGINVTRNMLLSGVGGIVLRAAANVNTATDRIMSIDAGVNATISGMTLENGNSGAANGGAILNAGSLTLNNVTVQTNRTDAAGAGGAIATTGPLVVTNSVFNANNGGLCGGAIYISPTGTGNISGTNFTNNQATSAGAICADAQLTLNGGALSANIATGNAGAILINSPSESLIQNASLSSNQGANGGAVFITNTSALRVVGTTFSFNIATTGTGGGIHSAGTLATSNVTVSTNDSASGGAGIHRAGGTTTLTNSTIAFNTSFGGNPSGLFGNMTLVNTLVDGNTAGDCSGMYTANFSLFGQVPATCTFIAGSNNNQLNLPSGLSPLGNNGGTTETHVPANPGNAINTGPPSGNANCPTVNNFDQRGISRPQGASCDIGAVEQ